MHCGCFWKAAQNDKQKTTILRDSGFLRFLVGNIFHDIFHAALQYAAEHLDGVGRDTFVALQPGDLCRADVVFLDQRILGDPSLLHHLPQVFI